MLTPTETKTPLPQGGVLITNGPFRLLSISEEEAQFDLPDHPEWGVLNLTFDGLETHCKWTREYLRMRRLSMRYFLHKIEGATESYEALTCWSPSKYFRLELPVFLQEILDKADEKEKKGVINPEIVKHTFIPNYMLSGPFSSYINMCDLSKSDKPGKRKRLPVLKVGLKRKLPSTLSLPTTYKGLRIVSKVIGPITLENYEQMEAKF